jgi:pimeloyl-ACP methyl ester carboxylesterase
MPLRQARPRPRRKPVSTLMLERSHRMMGVAALVCLAFAAPLASAATGELARRPGAVDEAYPGIDVSYDAVGEPGHRLRLITTRPHDASGKLPVIFVAGWLSCDSVEAPPGTKDATSLLFQRLAREPGFVLVRVDKPGIGDSEGSCGDTDFATELVGYRAAFRHMSRYDFIDADRVFVFGISNGGGFAPLVSDGAPVKGYVIDGAWVKTWFEHMMEIERRRLTLSGKAPAEVNDSMRQEAEFYEDYLVEGRTPRAILAAKSSLAAVWSGDVDHQYGRPIAFYQQLQALNLAEAWSHIGVPLLALHGQYDWIMSRDDTALIVELVNKNAPGIARLVDLADTGHTFEHYDNANAAFADKEAPFDPKIGDLVAGWFAEHR